MSKEETLLEKVLGTERFKEEQKRYYRESLHYSHRFGPVQIHREFKPMRDRIEIIAFAYIPDKVRVDGYLPGATAGSLENLDEVRRYSLWWVEQQLLAGNYRTKEQCAEDLRLWKEQYEPNH